MLSQKRPLTDFFNLIEDTQLDMSVPKNILNQDYKVDLYEKALQFLKQNGQNRHYRRLLAHLNTVPNPTMRDIVEFISRNENKHDFEDLKDLINQKDQKDRFLRLVNFIEETNDQGVFNDLLKHLKETEDPGMTELLKFALSNNEDGRYNPIIARIIGKKIDMKALKDLLMKYNRRNKYDNIIKYIDDNPNAPIDKVIEEIEKANIDGIYDVLIRYLYGNCDELTPSDQNHDLFLEDQIDSGDYLEVKEEIADKEKYDPQRLK